MIKKKFSFTNQVEGAFDGKFFVDRKSARDAFNSFITSNDDAYNIDVLIID